MSKDWVKDIAEMHGHYGANEAVKDFTSDKLRSLLNFRVDFLREELQELENNIDDPEEVVDALIDLMVVALGTLDLFQVDSYLAWDNVLQANMAKEVGVKPSRPNPLGLPDLVKPGEWVAPSHEGNHGTLSKIGA